MARRGRPSKNPRPDEDQTDLNILIQLRKVVNLGGLIKVEFRNGDKESVEPITAQKLLHHYDDLRRSSDKLDFQNKLGVSFASLCDAVSVIS